MLKKWHTFCWKATSHVRAFRAFLLVHVPIFLQEAQKTLAFLEIRAKSY